MDRTTKRLIEALEKDGLALFTKANLPRLGKVSEVIYDRHAENLAIESHDGDGVWVYTVAQAREAGIA